MKNDELVQVSRDRQVLHIVSSHSVGGTLRASDIASHNVVVWFDSLTIGPTRGRTLEETTRIRKQFFRKLSKSLSKFSAWDSEALLYPPSYAHRNRVLRHCGEWQEVALWFGPSMMEQFSLLQILAAIAKRDWRNITLVTCPKLALGIYRPEEMSGFFNSRNAISHRQIELAKRVWELYGRQDPMPLFYFAKRHGKSAPVLCNALLCQLESYPSVHNGLSLTEQALLEAVEARGTISHAVGHVLGHDNKFRTGDEELFESLLGFLTCDIPLIERTEKGENIESFVEFRSLKVRLSVVGRNVLSGKSDNVMLNGLNRWIGGVHLKGKDAPWRWDSERQVLKPS